MRPAHEKNCVIQHVHHLCNYQSRVYHMTYPEEPAITSMCPYHLYAIHCV